MSTNNFNPNNTNGNGHNHYNGYGINGDGGKNNGPGNPFNITNNDDEIDLTHIFRILWHHKWLVIGCTLLFSFFAGLYAYQSTPIYKSEGAMLIKNSQNRYSMTGSDIGNLLSSTYGLGVGSTVANELEILQSRSLSTEIANRVMMEEFSPEGKKLPVLWKSYPDDSTTANLETISNRIRNTLAINQEDADTDIVYLSYESPLPYEAMRISDLAMEVYSDVSTKQNRKSATSATNFLQTERDRLKEQLEESEDSLRHFMNTNSLMQVDAQTTSMIENISSLEKSRQEIKVKLVAVKSGVETYNESLNKIRPGLADQFSSAVGPKLQRFQFQLAELETEKLLLITENPNIEKQTPINPELKRLTSKINYVRGQINNITEEVLSKGEMYSSFLTGNEGGSIASQITELNQKLLELQIQKEQFEAQFEVITTRLDSLNGYFKNLPDKMMDLAQLKRKAKIAEELFLMISRQTAETKLWEQTQFGLGRIIDEAYYPKSPSKPQKKLYIVIGFLLGGVTALGYVFIREMLNTKIDGVEKLKKRKYPVLAVIPDIKQNKSKNSSGIEEIPFSTDLITVLDSISPASESFRRLQNNVIHSHPDEKFKTLMVTSPSRSDGKSTTVANLAVIMAETGNKILLADLDLRRPNVHRIFGMSRNNGLTETLFEQISLKDAIKSSPVENVDLLTSGQKAPNPAAVIKSNGLRNLILHLQQNFDYDHILLDTPPYGIISDTTPIMRLSDGVILVSRFDKTEESQLDQTIDNLEHINARILGTVLTGFDQSKSTDYYYASDGYDYYAFQDEYNEYHS